MTYNNAMDYLKSLTWDGVPRLKLIPGKTFYVKDRYYLYSDAINDFMKLAVKRVYEPGCQIEKTLLLTGAKGIGKSEFFRVLGGEFYAAGESAFESMLEGEWPNDPWILELKYDSISSKALLTARSHRLLLDTGELIDKASSYMPCVTSNKYCEDNRRFNVLLVPERIRLSFIKDNRDQLWAEAKALYVNSLEWKTVKDIKPIVFIRTPNAFEHSNGLFFRYPHLKNLVVFTEAEDFQVETSPDISDDVQNVICALVSELLESWSEE